MAKGCQHKPPQLGIDGHVPHTCRDQNGLVMLPHGFPNGGNVALGLFRPVVHPDAAGQIDECNMYAGGLLQADGKAKQLGRQFRIVCIAVGVAGQQSMNSKMLGAQLRQVEKCASHLVFRHAEFGVSGHVHDGIA